MGFHLTPRRGDRLLGHLRDHPAQGRGAGQRAASGDRSGATQVGVRARIAGIPSAAPGMEAAGWGGVLLTTYTKFTFSEFRVCVRAVFAFGAGYKLGERYRLGELERRRGQSADAEAWQLGYDLSTRRYDKAYGSAKQPEHESLDELYYRQAAAGLRETGHLDEFVHVRTLAEHSRAR